MLMLGCGGRTRTCDLVVMSHASCRCSTPRRMVSELYQTEVVMSTRTLILGVLAVQEKINPGLEIALVGRLFGFRAVGLGRARQVDGVSQRHARRHDDLFFAGRGQAEVLARRQLEVLAAVEVLVLERQVVILELLQGILLVDGRDLFLQAIVGLDAFDAAPTDQQYDHHKQHLPGEAQVA
jgi:hypothetical protein